jgi:hypothetical protein
VTTLDAYSKPNGEDLEALLAEAYAVDIPPHLAARLDQCVSSALRQRDRWNRVGHQPAFRRPRRLVLIPALLIVAITTVAAGVGLFYVTYPPEVFYPSDGGFTWDRGEPLGLTETVDDYRITLERAYADANKAMVAVSVADAGSRGWTGISVGNVTMTDSGGVDWQMTTGLSAPGSASTDANILWYFAENAPAPPGRRAFHVDVQSVSVRSQEADADGQWWHTITVDASFDFDLTVADGWEASPRVTTEHDGVTVALDRVVVAPSTVRLELRIAGVPGNPSDWTPILSVQHGGQNLAGESAGAQIGSASCTVYTSGGVDDASGDWTVTVSEIVDLSISADPQATQVRLQGPWILHFSMP